jgi:GNAT superfamily N-acetyltransferase
VRASAPRALDPGISLRGGTPGDATSISALAIQVFLDTYAIDGVRPDLAEEAFHHYGAAAFSARLAEPERRFVLAERENRLLGFAELRVAEEPAPAGAVSGAELVRLYVQPGAQRAGLGTALLARAEDLAAQAGLPFLWLTAWEGNSRALAFYAARGYADRGATHHAFQGRAYVNRVLSIRLPTG